MQCIVTAIVGVLVQWLIKALRWTWRLKVTGALPRSPYLLAFWHGHQMALAAARLQPGPAVLVSKSRDGSHAARILDRLGYSTIRGSSSRGGVTGALGVVRRLRRGDSAAIAVDGPRGPGYRAGPSATRLANQGNVPVVPLGFACSRGIRLPTWDRALIPAPFSKVRIHFGSPVHVTAASHCDAPIGPVQLALDDAVAQAALPNPRV